MLFFLFLGLWGIRYYTLFILRYGFFFFFFFFFLASLVLFVLRYYLLTYLLAVLRTCIAV